MSIQGYAEGIKDGVFREKGVELALSVIVEESIRLKNIVEELVYLTKIETMEGFLKPDLENIGELIKESISKVKGVVVYNNVSIDIINCEDMFITVDKDKIIQALLNIFGNCLRHAVLKVFVNAGVNKVNTDFYKINIWDDGSGFTEEDFKNAFRRFYKGQKGSTGLGLAITKAIIERHNGIVEISNMPEGGALYTINIPIAHSPASKNTDE
jgi:signal transduction histidine kinase